MELLQFVDSPGNINLQCVVCNCDSFDSYIDLSLDTSKTTLSETHLKDKIKLILNNNWISCLSDSSFSLCLPCFNLVDQYDSLEAQLKIIHNEICNKYVNSHCIISTVQTGEKHVAPEYGNVNGIGERTKRTTSTKRTSNRRKKVSSDNIATLHAQIVQLEPETKPEQGSSELLVQWHTTPVAVYDTAEAAVAAAVADPMLLSGLAADTGGLPMAWTAETGDGGGGDQFPGLPIFTLDNPPPLAALSTSATLAEQLAEQAVDDPGMHDGSGVDDHAFVSMLGGGDFAIQQLALPAAAPPLPTELQPPPITRSKSKSSTSSQPPPLAVYDDALTELKTGERLRVGTAASEAETEETAFTCCYCSGLFADALTLRQHTHDVHRPVVLTANIPPHLGLGSKANCGVEMFEVTAVGVNARPFVCIHCDGAFKFRSNIFLHYKNKHTPHKPFTCPDCQEAFRRSIELSRHRVYYCPHRKKTHPGVDNKHMR